MALCFVILGLLLIRSCCCCCSHYSRRITSHARVFRSSPRRFDADWPKSHLQMNPNLSRSCGASAPQPPVRARATRASRGQCACARGISQICAHPLRCNDRNVCALIQAKLTRTNSTNGHSGREKHSATVDTPIGCSSTRWSVSQSVSEPLQ